MLTKITQAQAGGVENVTNSWYVRVCQDVSLLAPKMDISIIVKGIANDADSYLNTYVSLMDIIKMAITRIMTQTTWRHFALTVTDM